MGANASGKTSLGKALANVFYFLKRKDISSFDDTFLDEKTEAYFSIDFLTGDDALYRAVCTFSPGKILSLDIFSSEITAVYRNY